MPAQVFDLVQLKLEPHGSLFVVFRERSDGPRGRVIPNWHEFAPAQDMESLGMSVIAFLLGNLSDQDLSALRKAVQGRIDERKAERREAAHADS